MLKEEVLSEVVFQAEPITAEYISTKPLHHSQKQAKTLDNGKREFRIKVIPNTELRMLLMSYGSGIQVIYPESLVNAIKDEISKLKNIYG
jgi:predicted DNA-binding transcriptional regulator YafY